MHRAPRLLLALILCFACSARDGAAEIAPAAEVWTVAGGQTEIRLNHVLLKELGLGVATVVDAVEPQEDGGGGLAFVVRPESSLRFTVRAELVERLLDGRLTHEGGLLFEHDAGISDFIDFAFDRAETKTPDALLARDLRRGIGLFEISHASMAFDAEIGELVLGWVDLRITAEWAEALGRPNLAGWAIGEMRTRLSAVRTGTITAAPLDAAEVDAAPRGDVLDISISALSSLAQIGRVGTFPDGVTGMAMSTTSCNVGTVDVNWNAPMATTHPVIAQNLYRIRDNRLEQIGAAWLKHGFFATNSSGCGTCDHPGTGSRLGPGCSDTYNTSNNSDRNYLGPREEVNPYTGVWTCVGSHFSGGQPDCVRRHGSAGHNAVQHLMEVRDADLGDASAVYRYEGYYVVQGDVNTYNNIAWRTATTSWTGSAWSVSTTTGRVEGPVINSWGDARTTVSGSGDGDAILAVATTDLGGGTWHYEYALYNHNMDRQIRAFSVPLASALTPTNVEFRDVDDDAGNDWSVSIAGGAITWETETHVANPNANSLRYGTLYNFRFDVTAAPEPTTATLGLFKPGSPTELDAATTGPPQGPLDCNMNGIPDDEDIATGTSDDCDANGVPDECQPDCNGNDVADPCDISGGASDDCDANGVPDECQPDCDSDGTPDACEEDCNMNGVPDECEGIADCNGNKVPDACEPYDDCNGNDIPDTCDLLFSTSQDCQPNGVPDECDLAMPPMQKSYLIVAGARIPPSGSAGTTIHNYTVNDAGEILDVDVRVDISHTWVSDLQLNLAHLGTSVTLAIGLGGSGDNYTDTVFDDEAATPITSGSPPFTGTFRPQQPLSAFDALDKLGLWSLTIIDSVTGDSGMLHEWELRLLNEGTVAENDCQPNGVPDECEPDCDGNDVPDDCEPDGDGDDVPDACDGCPADPDKTAPGACGCGVADTDSDGDETPDCLDECPDDPEKVAPGACGCGVSDVDSDGDTVPDCTDECPDDPQVTVVAPESEADGNCADGIDNDCDGAADAADPDCPAAGCRCGDLDTSGGPVDLTDFSLFSVCFGEAAPTGDCPAAVFACADLDGNGVIDLTDFTAFSTVFGLESSDSPPNCQ